MKEAEIWVRFMTALLQRDKTTVAESAAFADEALREFHKRWEWYSGIGELWKHRRE